MHILLSLFLLLTLGLSLNGQAQQAFKPNSLWVQVGGSAFPEFDGYGTLLEMQATLSGTLAVDVGRDWSAGLRAHRVFYRREYPSDWEQMYMAGFFARYKPYVGEQLALYLESGFYVGNYCTCGEAIIPGQFYRDEGLHYLSLGGGLLVTPKQPWLLELGLSLNPILNRPDPKVATALAWVGIGWRLWDRKAE